MESYALGDVFAESGYKPASIVPLEDTQIQSFIENGATHQFVTRRYMELAVAFLRCGPAGYIAVRASALPDVFHAGVVATADDLKLQDAPGWSVGGCACRACRLRASTAPTLCQRVSTRARGMPKAHHPGSGPGGAATTASP